MKKYILAIPLFLSSCSLLTIDYSDYPLNVTNSGLAIYDLSNNAKSSSKIYFDSYVQDRSLGDVRHLIVMTELDGTPTPKPKNKGRIVEGLQAVKLTAGLHSIKFQWISVAPTGLQFNIPYSLISFNFEENKRYMIRGSHKNYWLVDLDTNKTVEADIKRGI